MYELTLSSRNEKFAHFTNEVKGDADGEGAVAPTVALSVPAADAPEGTESITVEVNF